jgi:uncharacterized protein (DUF433 family)
MCAVATMLGSIWARIWHDQGLAAVERAERLLKSLRPGALPRVLLSRMREARLAYPEGVAYERITIDPNRMSGLPCIRDTRVTVSAVLGQLAAGRSSAEILVDYPYLERADILAALEFAAAAVQERELPLAEPA